MPRNNTSAARKRKSASPPAEPAHGRAPRPASVALRIAAVAPPRAAPPPPLATGWPAAPRSTHSATSFEASLDAGRLAFALTLAELCHPHAVFERGQPCWRYVGDSGREVLAACGPRIAAAMSRPPWLPAGTKRPVQPPGRSKRAGPHDPPFADDDALESVR